MKSAVCAGPQAVGISSLGEGTWFVCTSLLSAVYCCCVTSQLLAAWFACLHWCLL